jgi:EAL domain-containing protein (putative c-di-GMP-specific phosphodiesterase class I)
VSWNAQSGTPLVVNVNVSALQFHHPTFVEDLRAVLAATGLAPELLTIELTESVLAEHVRVEAILGELRDVGVGVAIDDFGTGYSSLAYLQRFDISGVKVDRAFIADLTLDSDPGLVRGILAIAEALSLTTVAEGVETAEQLAVLDALGCPYAQGWHLGRPKTGAEAAAMVDALAGAGSGPAG